jgi:hypothetical protein
MKKLPEQLDLLSWRPAASLIAFPLQRRIGFIRMTVDGLNASKPGTDAFWLHADAIFAGLHEELAALGYGETKIDLMLTDFADAVFDETCRRSQPWSFRDHEGFA